MKKGIINDLKAIKERETRKHLLEYILKEKREIKRIKETNKELGETNNNLLKKIGLDSLTKIYSRRKLKEDLEKFIEKESIENYILNAIMIDIDDFKSYNDQYGHIEGDNLLEKTAGYLKRILREEEQKNLYRYGGEEFTILIPRLTLETTVNLAERLKKGVEENCERTISLGIANYPANTKSIKDIISSADKALYCAKQNGKNRVETYSKGISYKEVIKE